jgi:hypothetical protein
MFDLCVETEIAVIQALAIGVFGIQERENSMDAGRGEWKAKAQASLTPTHSDLTRAYERH